MLNLNTIFHDFKTTDQHNRPYDLLIILSLALLYFVSGKISLLVPHGEESITIAIFAPEGFALAAALLFGKRVWPGVFIGQLVLALSEHVGLMPALFISISNALEVILAVYIFRRFPFSLRFDNLRDTMKFVSLIIFVLQPFSALSGMMVFYTFSIVSYDALFSALFSWWFGNLMGQLLITTALLILYDSFKKIHFLELFIYTFFFSLLSYLLLVVIKLDNISIMHSITITLVIFLIAYRELLYASFVTLGIAIVTTYSVYINIGMFTQQSLTANIINVNMYILAHIFVVLILGTLFNERKNREELLQESIRKALDENKKQQEMMLQQNRLAEMGEVINMIAHQWRQPLNNLAIINQTLLMKYRRKICNASTVETFAENSDRQIQEMSKIIDDFRDFFQPRRKKTDFFVHDIITHVLELIDPILKMHAITIDVTDHRERYPHHGYSNEFGQAILNIINNAKDALIEHKVPEKQIHIEIRYEQKRTVITVQDNAGGIPNEIIHNVFDPYFSTKLHKNGTGLGLYMSKNIIEQHMMGGLSVNNEADGAKFTIILNNTFPTSSVYDT